MSDYNTTGGPAFPIPIAGCNDGAVYNSIEQASGDHGGMTLRDYFAAKVMARYSSTHEPEAAAHEAYRYADAMLAARR
jgi:hypothetical protein